MARCLIIGCGCRGRALATELVARGHVVRGTTRDEARLAESEAAGADPLLGDPDRVATLKPALDHVSVVCILLGFAAGSAEQLEALHSTRLQMLLHNALDTTVRGVVYEAAGSVDAGVLERGAAIVRHACETSRIPYRLLSGALDYTEWERWALDVADAVEGVLE